MVRRSHHNNHNNNHSKIITRTVCVYVLGQATRGESKVGIYQSRFGKMFSCPL